MLMPIITLTSLAQPVVVDSPARLIESNTPFFNAKWSPDGKNIAFTSLFNKGIWVFDISTKKLTQLTYDDGTGFGFSWSPDSKSILARKTIIEGPFNTQAVYLYYLDNRVEPLRLTDFIPSMPKLPFWNGTQVSYFNGKEYLTTKIRPVLQKSLNLPASGFQNNTKFIISKNGTEIEVDNPFPTETLLNLTVSANGNSIAFEIYGGNLFTLNTTNGQLKNHGIGNKPSFSPDGEYIVYMHATDDGHEFTYSDLFASSVNDDIKVNLTTHTDLISLNPDWSPDGKSILFDSPETGYIYILPIQYDIK